MMHCSYCKQPGKLGVLTVLVSVRQAVRNPLAMVLSGFSSCSRVHQYGKGG